MTHGDDRTAERDMIGLRLANQRRHDPAADEAEGLDRTRLALVARVIEAQRTLAGMQATLVEMLASLVDGRNDESGPVLRVVSDPPADAG